MALYYPPNQIKPNLFANSGEFIFSSNNLPFSGLYHQLSNSRYYTGALHSNDSLEIIQSNPLESTSDSAVINSGTLPQVVEINILSTNNNAYSRLTNQNTSPKELPVNLQNLPTEQNYQIGEFTRYFAKKINQNTYIEFTQDLYNRLISRDQSIYYEQYTTFKLPWRLIGDKQQVARTNKNIVDLVSQQFNLSRFGDYLNNNYAKYFKFPNISNLYTSGGEFKTKDGQNYIGFYHIHDNTGPMVGATHTKESHGLLFPINEVIISKITTQYSRQLVTPSQDSITTNKGTPSGGGGGY